MCEKFSIKHATNPSSDPLPGQTLSGILETLHETISPGLLYTHTRINDNTKKILESSSFLYALIELLNEKGLLTITELETRKKQVAERLVQKFVENGIGLICQDPEYDKYTFAEGTEGDCRGRLEVCKAVCCKIPFALSLQDVEERSVCWDYGRPYVIAHAHDDYCVHLNRETYQCSVYEQRPVPCRGFECRNNKQWLVWADYTKSILNPELDQKIKETNEKFYAYLTMR